MQGTGFEPQFKQIHIFLQNLSFRTKYPSKVLWIVIIVPSIEELHA
jgi:hypothetical protein